MEEVPGSTEATPEPELHRETKMEEAQGKKKCPLRNLRDKPITQERLAALLDITPRAINEMRKRGVLPAPTTAYPIASTDRNALASAVRALGVRRRML